MIYKNSSARITARIEQASGTPSLVIHNPEGQAIVREGTLSNGIITYVAVEGDLPQAGIYVVQPRIDTGAGFVFGDTTFFQVQ